MYKMYYIILLGLLITQTYSLFAVRGRQEKATHSWGSFDTTDQTITIDGNMGQAGTDLRRRRQWAIVSKKTLRVT